MAVRPSKSGILQHFYEYIVKVVKWEGCINELLEAGWCKMNNASPMLSHGMLNIFISITTKNMLDQPKYVYAGTISCI